MEELLKGLAGKQIDVAFGTGSVVRGDVMEVRDGLLFLEDEEKRSVYVAIDKITVVWDVREVHSRPGFVV